MKTKKNEIEALSGDKILKTFRIADWIEAAESKFQLWQNLRPEQKQGTVMGKRLSGNKQSRFYENTSRFPEC